MLRRSRFTVGRGACLRPATLLAANSGTAARQCGITFAELLIIMVIVAMMAGMIAPKVAAFEATRKQIAAEASVIRLPAQARGQAAKLESPVRLRVDGSEIVMEQMPVENGQFGDAQAISRLPLPDGMAVNALQLNGQPVNPGDWVWTVYPDGESDSAAMEFTEGSVTKSLIMPANSNARWITGAIPEQGSEKWPAGQLAVRTTQ